MISPTLPRRQRRPSPRGAWALAGVAAEAFICRPQFARMRLGPLRLVFWAQLALGDYRTDSAGTSVCALSGASARPRVLGWLAGLAGVGVLAALWVTMAVTWPVWVVFILAGWLYLPMARTSLAGIPARRALARSRPPGRAVTLHTVASVVPGAGARLLTAVTGEADREGWTLVLVAANARLARYYAQFGFVATGDPVVMPAGEAAVPMSRRPRRAGEADGG